MSDPTLVTNATPADPNQNPQVVDATTVPAVPLATDGSASGGGGGGSGFSSFATMGDLQRNSPELFKMIQTAIFMYIKRVQDSAMARIKARNREANSR